MDVAGRFATEMHIDAPHLYEHAIAAIDDAQRSGVNFLEAPLDRVIGAVGCKLEDRLGYHEGWFVHYELIDADAWKWLVRQAVIKTRAAAARGDLH